MSLAEVHLALLSLRPAHGYDLKREYDAWFPDAKPLPFAQVYSTLRRLVRDGLAEVSETRSEGGPERIVYTVTGAGRERLRAWLAELAPPTATGAEELVRKTIAALHTGGRASSVVADQRTAYLRAMQTLSIALPGGDDAGARLARRYAVLHLEADVRWLDEAAIVLDAAEPIAFGEQP
jgi:DNA-binding PadR family transcriptional regulator